MGNKIKSDKFAEAIPLSASELAEIDQKVTLELNNSQIQMIRVGSIANTISVIFTIYMLYGHTKLSLLLSWFVAVAVMNIINISFSLYYKHCNVAADDLKPWRNVYHVIMVLLCLTFGCGAILYTSNDTHLQIFILAFLLFSLVAFGFGTITDFIASAICIVCLLIPYLSFHIYVGIQSIQTTGGDANLDVGISGALFLLGIFMLVTSYIGYVLIKKSFRLSFINVALSKKLESANKFLEIRVQERTAELQESLKKVTYQATHDLLTELPNRRLLFEYMKMAVKTANQNKSMFAVAFFSLNEIEKINDALGHQAGEQVIQTIAQRFKAFCESTTSDNPKDVHYTVTLSRRDEFVILLEPIAQLDEVEAKAELLFSVLDESVNTQNQALKLTASVGVSVYPNHGTEIRTLFMNADAARLSKKIGGNTLSVYKAEVNADLYKQLELECDLHTAVKNNEFILQYQPFVDLKTGQICGMEALVRWIHPTLGFIPPLEFIQLAESNGVIIPLGEWVLRTACMQTKVWHDQGFTTLKVSVNLSSRQLRQKNIVGVISGILQETGLGAEFVELELTESEAFKDDVIPYLQQLIAMGLGLSIDDFGTGYSGLTNLKLLTISKLKIDKSFIDDVETSSDCQAIVQNTITLAKSLDITVLAEGVEHKEQLQFLRKSGCDMIQGYYFSRPVNVDVFTDLLTNHKSLTPSDLEG